MQLITDEATVTDRDVKRTMMSMDKALKDYSEIEAWATNNGLIAKKKRRKSD